MSKRENAATLYLYVKNYILKLLISGKYPSGSQLPTEYQLMKELNVGRATVRTALAQLEEEGTIYKRQGVGTFVGTRDKKFALEPFISFNFMLSKLGFNNINKVIGKGELKAADSLHPEKWEKGTTLHYVRRLRCAENTPIAIECNYFSDTVYKQLDPSKFEGSLAHDMLENMDSEISKIDSSTIIRSATQEECETFNIPSNEKIVQMTRWIYINGYTEPATFLMFAIPTHVLEFPFL